MTIVTHSFRISLLLPLLALAPIVGCDRNDNNSVQSYAAPKESAPAENPPFAQAPADEIEWKVPPGWKQLPGGGEMRYATFQAGDDPQAVLTVLKLLASARPALPNVRRWAGQLKLPEVSEADLPKYVSPSQVSGEQADLVDMTGSADSGQPIRLLAAIVPHGQQAWFFTLKGPASSVEAQKSNFDQFVRSIQFSAISPSAAQGDVTPAPPAASGERFRLAQWKTPEGWQEQPGSNAMRVTSFRIGSGEQSAEVIVSRIPQGQSGSLLDNVNRWRGQVGLEPVNSPKDAGFQFIPVAGREGMFLSYTGMKSPAGVARQVVVAMTLQGADDWYIKMLGPEKVVSAQTEAFKQFVSSLQFTPESK